MPPVEPAPELPVEPLPPLFLAELLLDELFLVELLRDELFFVPPLDFALVLRAPPLLDFAADLRPLELLFFAAVPPDFDFVEVDRFALVPVDLDDDLLPLLDRPPEDPPSSGHLPDITRCAASATASAMRAPSFVALDITEFAALLAVSAASIPASLIALRALGLALIAAAAAARPAASISLLIAALAILSTVELFDPDFEPDDFEPDDFVLDDLELVFFLALAIAQPPFSCPIDT